MKKLAFSLLMCTLALVVFSCSSQYTIAEAVEDEDYAEAERLINIGYDVNARNDDGYTALMIASWSGNAGIADKLIQNGANVNDKDYYEGMSALHWASYYGNQSVVEILLAANADPNVKDNYGNTPLHYAMDYDFHGVAEQLMARGADPNVYNQDGETPKDLADSDSILALVSNIGGISTSTRPAATTTAVQPQEQTPPVTTTSVQQPQTRIQTPVTSIRFIPPRNIHALVIGISNYRDRMDFPTLPYATNDAYEIASMLKNPEVIGIPEENVTVLTDNQATYTNIYSALDNLMRVATSNNSLIFFYYSGHGAPLTEGTGEVVDGVLVPYDAAINNLKRTGISVKELNSELDAAQSGAIIMLDSCFSGQGSIMPSDVRGLTVAPRQELIQSHNSSKVFITGSANNQFSNDYPQEEHGLFTYFVLEGLGDKRADRDYDGYVSMAELYEYVKANVTRVSATLTGYQEPQLSGNGTNLVINP